jgi:pyruvate dehydrogenase E2 component (dihydrolipoamide acetyltransferase)
MNRRHLVLPDLGVGDEPVTVSLWLVQCGEQVFQGDPVLEVLTTGAVVDLPAPADGVLVETLVEEDEPLHVGQPLAVIELPEQF